MNWGPNFQFSIVFQSLLALHTPKTQWNTKVKQPPNIPHQWSTNEIQWNMRKFYEILMKYNEIHEIQLSRVSGLWWPGPIRNHVFHVFHCISFVFHNLLLYFIVFHVYFNDLGTKIVIFHCISQPFCIAHAQNTMKYKGKTASRHPKSMKY